jgi:hypothetical protein
MVFRVNFLGLWIMCNTIFAIVIENIASGSTDQNNTNGFLQVFALYLAFLVLYKVFFGAFHILKFKILRNFCKRYKTFKIDLHEDTRKLMMEAKDWNESLLESGLKPDYNMVLSPDEEEDEHLAEQSFLQMNKFNFN